MKIDTVKAHNSFVYFNVEDDYWILHGLSEPIVSIGDYNNQKRRSRRLREDRSEQRTLQESEEMITKISRGLEQEENAKEQYGTIFRERRPWIRRWKIHCSYRSHSYTRYVSLYLLQDQIRATRSNKRILSVSESGNLTEQVIHRKCYDFLIRKRFSQFQTQTILQNRSHIKKAKIFQIEKFRKIK